MHEEGKSINNVLKSVPQIDKYIRDVLDGEGKKIYPTFFGSMEKKTQSL